MAVIAQGQITLSSVVDVKATYRYYILQSSTLAKPSKPTTNPPPSTWDDVEPTYTEGSTKSLYFVDCTVFSDDTFDYSEVSLSSAYEAAKAAYNKAVNAQNGVNAVTTRVTNAEARITQNEKDIELRVTTSEFESVEADTELLKTRMTEAETKITQNESEIELRAKTSEVNTALQQYYTKTETEAAIKVSSDGIMSSVSSIKIGGRNLIPDSEPERTSLYNDEYIDYINLTPIFDEHGIGEYMLSFDIRSADVTNANTVSVYILKGDTNDTTSRFYEFKPNYTTIPVTTKYVRHSIPLEVVARNPDSEEADASRLSFYGTYNTGNKPYVKNVKLERGNKATDWTPAPEDKASSDELGDVAATANDAQGRVSTAETIIQQLSDMISTLVVDENGQSLMTQTSTGWQFSLSEVQSSLDKTSEDLDTLNAELGNTSNTVSSLEQAISKLESTAEYIRIGTYEGEPCIEMGEADSDFKILITNTRIIFYEGSNETTYIRDNTLHTDNVQITNELRQGNATQGYYVWAVRSNGNYGLTWREV